MTTDTPTSAPTGTEAQHRQALRDGRFEIQHCAACTRHVYYPRSLCPHCGHAPLQWVAAQGTGTVHAATTVRRQAAAGGDLSVCLVELDEGVRLMSQVQGLPADQVAVGLRVRARIEAHQGEPRVVFEPLAGVAP
jgi:uncharacterized OB-fold protein